MGTRQFEVDIEALARALDDRRDFAEDFVRQDFHAGFDPGREHGRGLKYPLVRLRGLGQITETDERQLGELVDGVRAGMDVTTLADTIRAREDASPLAQVLADLAVSTPHVPELERGRAQMRILAGAIGAAYLGASLGLTSSKEIGTLPRELVDILAAVGGALASVAIAILHQTETE